MFGANSKRIKHIFVDEAIWHVFRQIPCGKMGWLLHKRDRQEVPTKVSFFVEDDQRLYPKSSLDQSLIFHA